MSYTEIDLQDDLSDLQWASNVLSGRGDDDDHPCVARSVARRLQACGCTAAIRAAASHLLGEPAGVAA